MADLLDRVGDLAHETVDRVRLEVTDRAQSRLRDVLGSDPGDAPKHDAAEGKSDPLGEPQPAEDGSAVPEARTAANEGAAGAGMADQEGGS